VTSAILAGDADVGVSVIKLERKMDAGPIVAQTRRPMPADARAGALTEELFHEGSRLLCDHLHAYVAGTLIPTPQDDSQASYIGMLSRDDGRIDWQQPATHIARMVRAYDPWPGTFTMLNGQPFRILEASVCAARGHAGTLIDTPQGVAIACGAGALVLHSVQPAGKSAMVASDWRRGLRTPLPHMG
jgi:methionyl-tRNA formyltransferase